MAPTAQTPRSILITGFGPFPGVAENVSASLAVRVARAAEARFPRRRIVAAALPTVWTEAPERLAELYAAHTPAIGLHLGVSQKATGLVLERCALNVTRDCDDAAGARPAQSCITPEGPSERSATLPVERILARLDALGIPARASGDAGAYLCNTVLFHALDLSGRQRPQPRTGFVHIPVTLADSPGPGRLTWEQAIAGTLEILRVSLGLGPRG